ncbi:MAG: hypothetical protein H0V27_03195 [Pyrinomonadaceae bacterium]|nr:hypothetical protein [Pyrinomonadaceae bacterium]
MSYSGAKTCVPAVPDVSRRTPYFYHAAEARRNQKTRGESARFQLHRTTKLTRRQTGYTQREGKHTTNLTKSLFRPHVQ